MQNGLKNSALERKRKKAGYIIIDADGVGCCCCGFFLPDRMDILKQRQQNTAYHVFTSFKSRVMLRIEIEITGPVNP
jgi:hypothetical protein